jgi:hypothetical protein
VSELGPVLGTPFLQGRHNRVGQRRSPQATAHAPHGTRSADRSLRVLPLPAW